MTPTAASPDLRPAVTPDRPALAALLEEAGLPLDGLDEALPGFVVAERDGALVGAAGLEIHGADGVLRSVVVAPALRGHGLGAKLTEGILAEARSRGLRRLYLLTTTADAYFPRHGFRRIERSEASEAVQQSVEFREACPASAVAMVLELGGGGGNEC